MRIKPHKRNLQYFYPKKITSIFFPTLLGPDAIGKEPASILQLSWRNLTLSRDCRGEGREESKFSLLCYKAEESMERWRSYSETKNPVVCLSTALSYGGWGRTQSVRKGQHFPVAGSSCAFCSCHDSILWQRASRGALMQAVAGFSISTTDQN